MKEFDASGMRLKDFRREALIRVVATADLEVVGERCLSRVWRDGVGLFGLSVRILPRERLKSHGPVRGLEAPGGSRFEYCLSLRRVSLPHGVGAVGGLISEKCGALRSLDMGSPRRECGVDICREPLLSLR